MASRAEILSTKVTLRAVTRVSAATSRLLNEFAMQPGGGNTFPAPAREGGYDIFNDTRTVGLGRAPDAPAGIARRQKVGRVNYTIPRMSEQLPLPYDQLINQRPIGADAGVIDTVGQAMIGRQQRFLGQRAANFRLVLLGGMMRGNIYAHANGDDLYFDYISASANYDLDYQIPAGNKSQLDMLGNGDIIGTSWDNVAANIPNDLMQIDAAFQELTGSRLERCVCNAVMWNNIINNDFVVAQAGIGQEAFSTFVRDGSPTDNGRPNTTFNATLRSIPWLVWTVTNEGLDLGAQGSTSYTKFIGDTDIWFGPDPGGPNGNSEFFEMLEGPEMVNERPGGNPTRRLGIYAFTYEDFNPASVKLFTGDNALPVNYVPAASAYGTVVF